MLQDSESAVYRLQETYNSAGKETLYNIVPEFGIHMELVWLIKLCLNETYSKVCIERYLSGTFPIKMVCKKRDDLTPLILNFALEYVNGMIQADREGLKLNGTH
jgi:hypothetical protein